MKTRASQGISLLEVLIALGLMAAMAAALAASMGLGVRLYDRTSTLSDDVPEIAARIRLRNLATFAVPPQRRTPFPAEFVGGTEGFEFTTLSETSFAPDAAALRVAVVVDGPQLEMIVRTLDGGGTVIDTYETILASRATGIQISYFDDALIPPDWLPEWTGTTRLPDLIRVEVAPGSRPEWPEFTVRPVLGN